MDKLSTAIGDNPEDAACFVDNVDNLSPKSVDNSTQHKGQCGNVDKLSPTNVDNPQNTVCFVDNVDKLSPTIVDNFFQDQERCGNVDKLSTAIGDNSEKRKEDFHNSRVHDAGLSLSSRN